MNTLSFCLYTCGVLFFGQNADYLSQPAFAACTFLLGIAGCLCLSILEGASEARNGT